MGSNGTENTGGSKQAALMILRLSSQMLSAVLTLSSLKARVVHMCAHVHVDMPVGVCTGSSEVSVICHPSLFSTIFVETGFLTHPGVGGFS